MTYFGTIVLLWYLSAYLKVDNLFVGEVAKYLVLVFTERPFGVIVPLDMFFPASA